MRTTLNVPTALVEEARRAIGAKSKTDTIVFALRDLIRRRHIEELKSLLGKVQLDIDLAHSRRRPGRPRKVRV